MGTSPLQTMTNVSVVIPARNEEANIERVVRSVAAQEPVREIIVVDDGSTDQTPVILERLRKEIPLLRVVRSDGLPDGWVGKNYALATGARQAKGEWLLFTDADTYHWPGGLKGLVESAESEHAALLSLSPGQKTPTWWEKAVIPYVFTRLSRLYPFEEVSDPASPRAAANGQFVLIRRDAFEETGGFDPICGEILEDVALARRVKESGRRLVFLPGAQLIETRMYRSFAQMWQGWTKNLFLLYDKRVGRAIADMAEIILIDLGLLLAVPVLAVATALRAMDRNLAFVLVVGLSILWVLQRSSYRSRLVRIGFSRGLAYYRVLGAAFYIVLLLNSIRTYKWGGHVNWKGRSYPVEDARGMAR